MSQPLSNRIYSEVNIRLYVEQAVWLKQRALSTEQSLAELIRQAVDLLIHQVDPSYETPTQEAAIEELQQIPEFRRRKLSDDSNPLG